MSEEQKKTRITVKIYGYEYTIVGTESHDHIQRVANMVDKKMREISSANPMLDTNKTAVLTAVNAVHEYVKLQEKIEKLEKEIKQTKD
ncbi:cell division protein ZapA [Bacillus ectoiniformans]|uniref:cell division protein ZapA n=1 Tax=Bacillus ectoiniformans TaxID=1494429 RepID=UPI001959CFA9|nr:cell division protein ZapA [Bacillus ectoiniformans]MBM7648876.1 cell division protein ZapA [Bacillus ectoiniformans]